VSALLAAIAGAAVGGVAALALCWVLHRLPLRGAAAVPPASADSALPQAWGVRFLEAMMSAAPEPMFVKDQSHRWIMVNRAFAEFFGTTPEAVIGKTDFDFLLEDSARQSWREDEEVLASRRALAREVLVARREGEPRWMLKTKTAVVLPDGTRYVVGMHFDVTEQRRARDEIAGARELLDAVLDAVPVALLAKDADGRFLLVNQAACDMHGVAQDWALGQRDADFYPPEVAARIVAEDEAVRSCDEVRTFEGPVVTLRGQERWALRRKRAFSLPSGGRGVVIALSDVTEQRDAALEVERTRRYLDAIIDAIPAPICVKDRAHRYVTVNTAFCALLGQAKQQLVGRSDIDYLLPHKAAEAYAEDDRAFASPAPMQFQGPGRSSRNADRWYLRTKAAIQVEGGEYITCVTTDITELKQAQSVVERSHAFLDALINAIPHAVFVKDREHRWVMVNDAACRLIGRSREWIIGRSDADQYDAPFIERAWAEDDHVFATGEPIMTETLLDVRHAREVWLLRSKSLIRMPDGAQHIVAVCTDITERHAAQVEAERNRQFLNLVLEAMPQGVFVKDEGGRWLMVNHATARMLGVQREQLEGRLPHEVLQAALADAVVEQDRRVLAHDGPLTFEQSPLQIDGRTLWIMKTASAVRLADGTRYIVGVNTDVSELKAATLQLQHAREFLDALLDAIPVPVTIKDAGHRRVLVNAAACAFVGQPREALLGRTDAQLFPPAQAQLYQSQDADALASDGIAQYEESFLRRDGTLRWVVKTKRAIAQADGERYLIMVSLDITERKAAESALERSRARLQLVNAILADVTSGGPLEAVLANAVRALWRAFPNLRVCYSTLDADGMLHVLHGCQPDAMRDLCGVTLDLNAAPGYLARLRAGELCEARAGSACAPPWLGADAGASLDLPLQHDDARLGLLSLDAPVVQDWSTHQVDTLKQVGDALQAALHAAHTDVQRRRAERETHSARELLDAVMQAVPVVVSVKDQAGRFLFMNQTAQEMLGAPAECFIGRTDLDMYPPAQAQRIMAQDAQARERREVLTFEEILTPVSGAALWVIKRKRGVDLPDGTRAVVTTVYDVTEVKRSEMELRQHRDHLQELVDARTRELREAVEAAQRASQAKSEFLANMSHELRTPMHAVLSFAQLGAERARVGDADVARLEQYFARIQQSGTRLLTLLDDLLDLAKLEAGRMHYELDVHDPAALAVAVVQELTPLADAAQVQLGLEARGPVPALLCDAVRLSQVLRNLVGNAIKFSRAGGRVCIELALGAPPPARLAVPQALLLRVLDEGIGIPEGEHDRIFDKFTQSSRTRSKAGGTGLGLPICREIVQAHAGAIWAENRRGAGACFTVALPLNAGVARPVQRMAGQKAG
jgi:PAS domain S-box-containing protein